MPTEHRQSIDERAELIEARARSLVAAAVDDGAPWCRRMGTPPTEPRARELWIHSAMTVAAYRDRHKVDGDLPPGGGATTHERADLSTSTTCPARGSAAVARSPTSAPTRIACAACRLRALSEFETSGPEVRVPRKRRRGWSSTWHSGRRSLGSWPPCGLLACFGSLGYLARGYRYTRDAVAYCEGRGDARVM